MNQQQFQQGFRVQFGSPRESILNQVLLGIAVLLFGVAMLMAQFGQPELYNTIRDWWPAGVVVYAAIQLISGSRSVFWYGMMIIVMMVIQLKKLGVVDTFWGVLWPILLIILGAGIVLSRLRSRRVPAPPSDIPGASYRVEDDRS